jgi:hypothetical protein
MIPRNQESFKGTLMVYHQPVTIDRDVLDFVFSHPGFQ